MLGRRNFVYKRTNNAHRGLFLRGSLPPLASSQADPAPSPSSDVKTPDPVTPSTAPSAAPQPTNTPVASSVPPSSASSAVSTPVSSRVESSVSAASSSASSSISAASASAASSHLALSPSTSANALPVATQAIPGASYTPTSTLSLAASATPSSGSSGGTSTGTIVGGVAGTLAGIAVLGLLLMWCMRRQRKRDIDDFDPQAFRQSAILVEDPVEPPQAYNPRPPTIIERHNASPALAAQSGHAGQNFYGGYSGYGQQSPYPEMGQYRGYDDPRQQISRQPSDVGYPDYDSQQQLARQPSNAQYLTRQPNAAAGYGGAAAPSTSFGQEAHYIDLNRSSVSPYQAAQYADISRQLGAVNPNQHVPHTSDDLLDGPLPSPFDDPTTTNPVQGNTRRPSVHFEEGDPYGGI